MFHPPENSRMDNDIDIYRLGRIVLTHHDEDDAEIIMLVKWGASKLSFLDLERVRELFDKHDVPFLVQGKHTQEMHRLKDHSPN